MHELCARVALESCADYAPDAVGRAVGAVLEASAWKPGRGRILVKPNLLRAHSLTCTHPQVVAAACAWLLDQGCTVTVADSPGFGSARGVSEAVGLADALEPLGLRVRDMGRVVPVPLPDGRAWDVSSLALESDALLSIPKVKAHSQMRLSLSVKNLFGCVCGLRKALAHTVQGQSLERFADAVVALWGALPPVAGLADGVEAMHVTGPSGGKAYALGCLGASASAVALDTAFYVMLGAEAEAVPLWQALLRRQIPDAMPERLTFPLKAPGDFPGKDFVLPEPLLDISFRPRRLLWSLLRRLWLSRS